MLGWLARGEVYRATTYQDVLQPRNGALKLLRILAPVLRELALLLMLLDVLLMGPRQVLIPTDDILQACQYSVTSSESCWVIRRRTSKRTFFITSFILRCSYRVQKV